MSDTTLLHGELRLAGRLDARFFALLQAIDNTGSINRAARTAGYSYKGAWLALVAAGNVAHAPLLASAARGTRLTPAAQALIQAWQQLQAAHDDFLRTQEAWLDQLPALAGTLRRMAMKTTARNQFAGTVSALLRTPASTLVTLQLRGGTALNALLCGEDAEQLKLKKGSAVVALVKASAVVLVSDFAGFVLPAQNQLAGTLSRIERGAVSSLIGLTLPGGQVLTASVTNDAVSALALAVGQPASAVFTASAVMLAVPAAAVAAAR